jgi:hypothetical protein
MNRGRIVAAELFSLYEAAPGIFADVPRWRAGHTRGHSIAPVQRLSGDGVPDTFQKDPKRYLHWGYLDISGHIWTWETYGNIPETVDSGSTIPRTDARIPRISHTVHGLRG